MRAPALPERADSGLLVLDIVDDFGHVVLVLAKLGGVLDQLLVLLLGLLKRHILFLLLGCLDIIGFEIGIDVVGADRLEFFLDRRGRPRPACLQKGLGIEWRAAFRADHGLAHQVVIARTAARADALRAPFGFGQRAAPWNISRMSVLHQGSGAGSSQTGRGIATASRDCQKRNTTSQGRRSTAAVPGRSRRPLSATRYRSNHVVQQGGLGKIFAHFASRTMPHPDLPQPSSPAPVGLTATRPTAPLAGAVAVPGDKSISHRALMFGALAVGHTEITGLLEGEDVLATAAALRAMGAGIERAGDGHWRIDGVGVGGLGEPEDVLDLGNSGTSARLLLGMLATHKLTAFVTGDSSLRGRPMQRVIDPLSRFGARFVAREGGRLPLAVTGAADPGPLEYRVPMSSAQGKSAGVVGRANNPRRARVGAEEPDPRPNPGQGR